MMIPRLIDTAIKAMGPQAFEDLVFALVYNQHGSALQLTPPDAGRDTIVPADETHGEWAWQAKHHTAGINWADCRKSLEMAHTRRQPERVTLVFPVNLTAGKEPGLQALRDEFE